MKTKKKIKFSISIQISIFLMLVAFIPVAVMMALKTYERQQLSMLENSNVQQARLVSAALGFKSEIDREYARALLQNMNGQFDSRIRILDKDGTLLADSASYADRKRFSVPQQPFRNSVKKNPDENIIYRILSFPIRLHRKLFRPPVETMYSSSDFYSGRSVFGGSEVKAALSGRYGAATRISAGDQVSVTLYSAVPVFCFAGSGGRTVAGAVLVNRSTYKILQNLYELRLDLGKIFLQSLAAVFLISLFLAFRISVPLKTLSRQAAECADKKGRIFFTEFVGSRRNDEIGGLSRSFSSLIRRLDKRILFSQTFSSDISHEFKNPLAAIRTSAELLGEPLSDKERQELSRAVLDEVNHLQLLLSGIRNISKIDAESDAGISEAIPANSCIQNVISRIRSRCPDVRIDFSSGREEIFLRFPQDYLERLAENLIENAAGFGDCVSVRTDVLDGRKGSPQFFCLAVDDNGTGVAEQFREKIFERFYSDRAQEQKAGHTGLGLSIVKSIADSMEGTVSVEQSVTLGGARFVVSVPM